MTAPPADAEREAYQTAAAGSGGSTPLVIVKPTGCDLARLARRPR